MPSNFQKVARIVFRGDTGQYSRDMNKIKSENENLKRNLESLRKKAALVFAAMAASAFAVTKAFSQWELALIGVQKTTNATQDEMKRFAAGIQELEKRLPRSAEELARIAANAAQLGVRGRENILRFTEVVAKMETATDVAGQEGTFTLVRFLNLVDKGTEHVEEFASTLVHLGNTSAATEAEILEFSLNLARGTASLSGIATHELAAIGTVMAEIGLRAGLSRTATSRFFDSVREALHKGGRELEVWMKLTGMSREALEKAYGEQPVRIMAAFTEEAGKVGNQIVPMLKEISLGNVQYSTTFATMAANQGHLTKKLEETVEAYKKNNALQEEFGNFMKALHNKVILLWNALKRLVIQVGEKLAPGLKKLTVSLTGLFQWITKNESSLVSFIAFTIKWVGVLAGAVVAVTSFKLALLGMRASGLIPAIKAMFSLRVGFSKLTRGAKIARIAMAGFWAATTLGISLVIAYLPEIIDWIVKVGKKLRGFGRYLEIAFGEVLPARLKFAGYIWLDFARGIAQSILKFLLTPFEAFLDAMSFFSDKAKTAREALRSFTDGLDEGLAKSVENTKKLGEEIDRLARKRDRVYDAIGKQHLERTGDGPHVGEYETGVITKVPDIGEEGSETDDDETGTAPSSGRTAFQQRAQGRKNMRDHYETLRANKEKEQEELRLHREKEKKKKEQEELAAKEKVEREEQVAQEAAEKEEERILERQERLRQELEDEKLIRLSSREQWDEEELTYEQQKLELERERQEANREADFESRRLWLERIRLQEGANEDEIQKHREGASARAVKGFADTSKKIADLAQGRSKKLNKIAKVAAIFEALVNFSKDIPGIFGGTLKTASGIYPPPIPQAMAATTTAAAAATMVGQIASLKGMATGGMIPGDPLAGDSMMRALSAREVVVPNRGPDFEALRRGIVSQDRDRHEDTSQNVEVDVEVSIRDDAIDLISAQQARENRVGI